MERSTELELFAALRGGDESAFAPLYDAFSARIFAFILRMVGRRSVAEELAQEVWLRLAARAPTLREDTRLEAWLFTVAHNLCISYWRTRGIEGFSDAEPDALEALRDPTPQPEQVAGAREMNARLERALASLPRPYRAVLLLVGVVGLTPAAAAQVCGVPAPAMRKRLERARVALALRMGIERPLRGRAGGRA